MNFQAGIAQSKNEIIEKFLHDPVIWNDSWTNNMY